MNRTELKPRKEQPTTRKETRINAEFLTTDKTRWTRMYSLTVAMMIAIFGIRTGGRVVLFGVHNGV